MKKSKKIVSLLLLLAVLCTSILTGCAGTPAETGSTQAVAESTPDSAASESTSDSAAAESTSDNEAESTNLMGEVLGDYVIELPVITEIDYEAGLAKNKEMFGKFGCSAIGKVLDNGDMIVGRSMDLYYSNNPAYVIRTDVEGFYKTVGLAYNTFDGHTFEDVKENGVTQDELLTLLFFSVDVMNEKGLYIEANMREKQPEETGIVVSTGTNPGAEVSLTFPALVRYLGERCATVDEAVELANSLNVCGMSNGELNWGGGYFMADASGHYGVLELVDNKLVWTDGQNCQANFYVNDEYKDRAIIGSGIGRYALLESEIESVKSEDDMTALMKKVRYSQILDPYNCLFDPRSEYSGAGEQYEALGGMLTIEMCQDDQYKDTIFEAMEAAGAKEREKSLQQLKDEGTQWLSVWQTTANCNKQSLKVIFFEDDALTFDFTV